MATAFIFGFSLGVVTVALLNARNCYLANKISSISLPPGSQGVFLRDVAANIIRNYDPFLSR